MLCPSEYIDLAIEAFDEGDETVARNYVHEALRSLSPLRVRQLLGSRADRLLPLTR
jgi:hypothetical protein